MEGVILRVIICLLIVLFVSEQTLEILDMYISPDLTFCNNATVVCKVQPCAASVHWTFSGKNITEEMRYMFFRQEFSF